LGEGFKVETLDAVMTQFLSIFETGNQGGYGLMRAPGNPKHDRKIVPSDLL
jgi:hypothetical protein